MYIEKGNVYLFGNESTKIYLNGAHICIGGSTNPIYSRETPGEGNWADKGHLEIMEAVYNLEKVIAKVVAKELRD